MRSTRHYIDLMFYKAYAELRAEATRAYLGFLWWFIEPIMFLAVFYAIFEAGLRRGGSDYVPFLLCGLIFWKWFASTVLASANVLFRNSGLIQQVYVPKLLLPGVVLIANSVKFLLVLALFLAFLLLALGKPVTAAWAALPLLLLVQFALIAGLSLFAAAVVTLAQDLKLLLDNLMMMLFFVSGIFFDVNAIEEPMRGILLLNPMAVLIDGYRDVLLRAAWPDTARLGGVCLLAVAFMAVGTALLIRFDRAYPKLVGK